MKTSPLAGPLVRVGVALLLCGACFQAGRWYQELSVPAHAGRETVAAAVRGAPEPVSKLVESAPLVSAGNPIGESGDIITPLNVRDPSALVMGPAGSYEPPAAAPPSPPKAEDAEMEAKLRALSQERLLEILRKAKKNEAPKDF